ncbi:MAG TPA: Gfo/Idh/MocA family oxidoreductase [Prolixibacteraceae bacterium]|nr:Gfo/Idh/MocA family oxidoreductase [Prolixibacteraceae bacterium]HPR86103.1 Gfo/Idh/MocA family oxidoreductase [Prolixibacteraceae bacterium]
MSSEKIVVGFLGAGGIARSHAFALNSLKYFYSQVPKIEFEVVCASRKESSDAFASKFGFRKSQSLQEFEQNKSINSVYILGPNKVHFEHLKIALEMPSVSRIYLEKPVCSNLQEEEEMHRIVAESNRQIQVGFQYLLTASVREAIAFWHSGKLGKAIHFDLKYYHGDYLQKSYREKRVTRLTPAPDGGAMADLGSHGISLLMAFLGENLQIANAFQAGSFSDVPADSDLFSSITLVDPESKAAGTMSASRISSGSGDLVSLEIYAEKGMLRYSSHSVDYFEYYLEETGLWTKQIVGSNYAPVTSFPSGHVPPGWLRSMIHAHYLFLGGEDSKAFVPDLKHGLAVQRIVRETADHLKNYRKLIENNGKK